LALLAEVAKRAERTLGRKLPTVAPSRVAGFVGRETDFPRAATLQVRFELIVLKNSVFGSD